jgi:hypothetical protein
MSGGPKKPRLRARIAEIAASCFFFVSSLRYSKTVGTSFATSCRSVVANTTGRISPLAIAAAEPGQPVI